MSDLVKENRDYYIDALRALGLLCLIIAHTHPNYLLKEFRAFDVPLMVFIAAICYKVSKLSTFEYYIRRIQRIYIPIFVFLTLYFVVYFIVSRFITLPDISISTICGSYMLINGPSIGYVWIMRVFILMAITLPLIYKLVMRINFTTLCGFLVLAILLQDINIYLVDIVVNNKYIRFILDEVLLYWFGYLIITVVGIKARHLTMKQILILALLSILGIISFGMISGSFIITECKYPPRTLYILYGVAMSLILWALKPIIKIWYGISAIKYLSANSMWLYLWHIIPVFIIDNFSLFDSLWIARYALVLISTILLNEIYHFSVSRIPYKYIH